MNLSKHPSQPKSKLPVFSVSDAIKVVTTAFFRHKQLYKRKPTRIIVSKPVGQLLLQFIEQFPTGYTPGAPAAFMGCLLFERPGLKGFTAITERSDNSEANS